MNAIKRYTPISSFLGKGALLLALILCAPYPALSEEGAAVEAKKKEEVKGAKFLVNIITPQTSRQWVARAFEYNVFNDLSDYSKIIPIHKDAISIGRCQNGELTCRLQVYEEHGIDIYMEGRLLEHSIEYRLYDTKTKSVVNDGTLNIAPGAHSKWLKINMFKAVKPFLEKGGIIDQRIPAAKEQKVDFEKLSGMAKLWFVFNQSLEEYRAALQIGIIIAAALFLVIPLIMLLIIPSAKKRRERQPYVSGKLLALFILVFACAFAIYLREYSPIIKQQYQKGLALIQPLLTAIPSFDMPWIVPLIGGIIWGFLIVIGLRAVFPSLAGFEKMEQHFLGLTLKSWGLMALARLLVFTAGFAVFVFLVFLIMVIFGIKQSVGLTVIAPIVGFVFLLWFFAIIEYLALFLDGKHVDGVALRSNLWHGYIEKYFCDYLAKQGITSAEELVANVIFLPGNVDDIVSYGGGFAKKRIVIGKSLLKFTFGSLMERLATHREKSAQLIELRKELGEAQKSHKKLLQKHKRAKDKSKWEPSIAQIDAKLENLLSQEEILIEESRKPGLVLGECRDFLFGALLQEMAQIHRYNHILNSLSLVFLRYKSHLSASSTKWLEGIWGYLKNKQVTSSRILIDSFVATHMGLHHLLQYLYLREYEKTDYLTINAGYDKLQGATRDIFHVFEDDYMGLQSGGERGSELLARVLDLSRLFEAPIKTETGLSRITMLLQTMIVLIVLAVVSFYIYESASYNAVYKARMERFRVEIEEANKKLKEGEKQYDK